MGAKSPLILIGTFLNRFGSYGGSFFDEAGNPTINSPEAVAALTALVAELNMLCRQPARLPSMKLWVDGSPAKPPWSSSGRTCPV